VIVCDPLTHSPRVKALSGSTLTAGPLLSITVAWAVKVLMKFAPRAEQNRRRGAPTQMTRCTIRVALPTS
jgi:hypothetical protein